MRYISKIISLISIFIAPLLSTSGWGAITSVTLTPSVPNTLSNGKAYYLAGVSYSFRVQATDPAATGKAYWNQIIVRFREGAAGPIRESFTINVGPDTFIENGVVVDTVVDNTVIYTNLDYQINIRFRWDCTDFNAIAVNEIEAYVDEDLGSNDTDTNTINYGVCASTGVLNFIQTGDAADGRINPWHLAFNVTGAIVYYINGEGLTTNEVDDVDGGEITNTELLLDSAGTGFTDNTMGNDLTYNVTAGYVNTLGNHNWRVRATMNTAPGTEDTAAANQLAVNCDRVEITNIEFINGGGVNSPYYRSVNQPGTQIRLTAQMENGGGAIVGNTTITVRNTTEGANFTVNILDGATQGVANVPNPTVAANVTEPNTYRIESISGGAYDDEQNVPARITQPANPVVYWDNDDPPGVNSAPFTAWSGISQTAYSLTFSWSPLTTGGPPYDEDFYTYRLYYREEGASSWLMVDRSSSGFASLGTIGTGTVTITNLQPLTNYDYYITATDVFGQEVYVDLGIPNSNATYEGAPNAVFYGTASTIASSIEVTITDGITEYDDDSFTSDKRASARPLRETAVKVTFYIVSTGGSPDAVNLILAADGTQNLISGGDLASGLQEGTDYYSISCSKASANTWETYIPETNPLIEMDSDLRFIVQTRRGSSTNYADHDSESESPPGDPNDYEWTFGIDTETQFTPWPTRILNNVITDRNPVAYPAYYLTSDAFVTINVYDIKGRVVAKILDKAYRRGGQNIKEQGWRGTNKASKKLGVGLYYIHIKANRAVDGKLILNKFKKVVIAR